MKPIATFSIVAYDPSREEWGVAVQSKFLAVGSVVSWARAGAGAVATQCYANLMYGPDGLEVMGRGVSAEATIKAFTSADDGRDLRQVGMVDAAGNAHAFTGDGCSHWAGHHIGDGYCCQGNILVPGTVEAMAKRFEEVRGGAGELADWLIEALAAGQAAGGDSRGRQSAAVLVTRAGGGYGGNNDRYLDLRVDDDPFPIKKLKEIAEMHHLFFSEVRPDDLVTLDAVAEELQQLMTRGGTYDGPINGKFDATSRAALQKLLGNENLEMRWPNEGDAIDRLAIHYLQSKL